MHSLFETSTFGRRQLSNNPARGAIAGLLAVIVLTACGSGTSMSNATSTSGAKRNASAAAAISESTRMICASEVQKDLRSTLGTKTTRPIVPRWIDYEYSCEYSYARGAFRLAVKQLPDATATRRYFQNLATRLGRRQTLQGLGEGAFTTRNGSVVVRKDNKVLTVDVHHLPSKFGNPPDTRGNVAISIAATIMGCWTEA
jgi:hypothetical protein